VISCQTDKRGFFFCFVFDFFFFFPPPFRKQEVAAFSSVRSPFAIRRSPFAVAGAHEREREREKTRGEEGRAVRNAGICICVYVCVYIGA